MRTTLNINDNWLFTDKKASGDKIPKGCESVTLPHTWNGKDGQDGGNDYYRGKCAYYKEIPGDMLTGEENYIEFGAVNSSAEVFWNGEKICVHHGGYSLFRVKIPDVLENNLLCIFADNSPVDFVYPQLADFTFYGGIYRDVNIISVPKNHFDLMYFGSNGFKVIPVLHGENAEIELKTYIKGENDLSVTYRIIDGDSIVSEKTVNSENSLCKLSVKNPKLWNGRHDPHLYTAEAILSDGETELDKVSLPFGIREFHIDPEKGFYLNGRSYPLHGVSRHQDRPDIGNALLPEHHREDIDLICEMGANTVRLAHYQHSPVFYDLCDEKGLVVWAEIPFISTFMPNGVDNTISQMRELVVQNYNRPSIVTWGLSNEITMGGGKKNELIENHKKLNALVHSLDSTRLTTAAVVSTCPPSHEYTFIPDMISYNHYFGWYGGETDMNGKWFDSFHKKYPDRIIGLSEYGAEGLEWHTSSPEQGDYSEEYQSLYHEELIKQISERPYLWATHVWNMFDFASDARSEGGHPGKNHKGLVSFDRKYKKDAFYAYKAWLSQEPVLHICSKGYIDRTEDITNIKVYSNLPYVELYVNGELCERKEKADYPFYSFKIKNEDESVIKAKSGVFTDESRIRKVSEPNRSYIMNDSNAVINWYEITAPAGYYNINNTVGDILRSPRGALLLASAGIAALKGIKGGEKSSDGKGKNNGIAAMSGLKISKTLIDTGKSFTLKRLFMMSGELFGKEDILKINEKLNMIKRKEIKHRG